ncbi:hypothetical protein B1H29_07890 [Streptomyces pactum]|uniref:Uncharacterized protein n=1 Tax=Streptomyces pactum TaxID=68249 RepID=A0A1S6J536_9ACTN|nr:hypothetical protein B1H29_07890 [Streptomyces pactum]
MVVAEHVRDHGGGHVEELLADGGAAGSYGRDPDLVQQSGQVIRAERLAGPAAGEEPAGRGVGGGVHVVAVCDVFQQVGDRLRDR